MFEKIILRRSDEGSAITIGELAEALLFYQNVHIVLDWGSLNHIVKMIGMPTLLSLLSRPNVSAVYCETTLGTQTNQRGPIKEHSFVGIYFTGTKEKGQFKKRKKRLEYMLSRHGYGKRKASFLVDRFRRLVPIRKLTDDYFIKGGILKAAWVDLLDPDFILEAMRRVSSHLIGQELMPAEFSFKVHTNHPSFSINTNLDIESINTQLKSRDSSSKQLSEAGLINNVLTARADTVLAAYYGGEFYTSDLASELIRLKHEELLKRIGINQQELRQFSEIVITDGPSLREVLNSGERSFDEFLSLLDKSQKFREWAQGINPDEKLVKSYLKDLQAKGWISKLPSKLLRYLIGASVGLIEPISGLAVSAADSFMIDKIMGGWRASHFIERKLKPFLNTK